MKRYPSILLLLFCMLCATPPAFCGLTLQPFTLLPGQTADVAVSSDSAETCTALMFDITFPDEVRLKAVAKGTAATASHSVSFSTLPNGDSRVVAFSSGNEAFLPTGSLVILTIEDGDKAAGSDSILIHNLVLTDTDGKDRECTDNYGHFTATIYGDSATAPTITLAGQTITINAGGNPCYYTFDGTEPSRFGTQYTAPFTVSHNGTVRAIATEAGKDKSATTVFEVNTFQVARPVITMKHDTCTIICSDAEAIIHYSTDGSAPSLSSGIFYDKPFTVQGNCTILACASKEDFNTSETDSCKVDIFTASAPKINFAHKKVTLTTSTDGASIHYTLDGSTPTEASALYSQPIVLYRDTQVKAIAVKHAFNPSPVAEALFTLPTITIATFSIKPGEKVKAAVNCTQATDGSALMFDAVFSDELRITKAEKGEGATSSHAVSFSDIGSGRFRIVAFSQQNAAFTSESNVLYLTIEGGDMEKDTCTLSVEQLVVTTAAGNDVEGFSSSCTYHSQKNGVQAETPTLSVTDNILTISSPGNTSYFTLDGSEPSRFGTEYTGSVLLTRNCTIKAIAAGTGKDKSATVSMDINTFIVEKPSISWDNDKCTITCPTPESSIFYTQDGTDPTSDNATLYKNPFAPLGNVTIQACAKRDGYTTSAIDSLVIDTFTVATPLIVFKNDTLILTTTTEGALLYYTTDSTQPTKNAIAYTQPTVLDGNVPIRAIALKKYYNDSKEATDRMDWFKVATPVVTMIDDSVFTITTATPGATIYYTTDGTQPDTSSAIYTAPLILLKDCTIKAYATKKLYHDSDSLSQVLKIIINILTLNDIKLAGEETGSLILSLANRTPFTAMMLDIHLPDGLKMIPDTTLVGLPRLTASHTLGCQEINSGVYRVVIFSSDNTPIDGESGELFVMPVYAVNSTAAGTYSITCSDITGTTADGKDKTLSPCKARFVMNPYAETVATPAISASGQQVTISCTTENAEIHYTTDGTYPTSKSLLYTEPFTIERNLTVKAIGIADGWNQSTAVSYEVNHLRTATPVLFLTDGKTVTLDCSTEGASIFYSLKGSDKFQQYTQSFTLKDNTLIKAYAQRDGWLASDTLSRTIAPSETYLEVSDITCNRGTETTMKVYLHASDNITAYQMDIALPEGITIIDSSLTIGDRSSSSHVLASAIQTDKSLRAICYSAQNASLPDNDEALLSFKVSIPDSIAYGYYDVTINGINLTTIEGREIPLNSCHGIITLSDTPQGQYSLTYVVDGQEYQTDTFNIHESITLPKIPVKTGHTFSHWAGLSMVMPANDNTVTAVFTVNSYKLTYIVDGYSYTTSTQKYGSSITPEPALEKEGYTFSGWSEIPSKMPAYDVTVTGDFTLNSYILTYLVDGRPYANDTFPYSSKVVTQNKPAKEGYTFHGWDKYYGYMPACNDTINGYYTVNYYQLTYELDGQLISSDSVAFGTPLTPLEEPVKEGHTFSGWSENHPTMPSRNVNITGYFTINTYNLTYIIDEDILSKQTVTYHDSIRAMENPSTMGYTFSGWKGEPEIMPAHDVVVNGHFEANRYLLTYLIDGDFFLSDSIAYGSAIPAIDHPVLEGYYFSDWVDMPDVMPAHDVTVNGHFCIESYILTYIIDDEIYSAQSVAYHDSIAPMSTPSKAGCTFSGWQGEPVIMPAHDVTVSGTFITGETSATPPDAPIDVYNLQGLLILRQADEKDLMSLPPGLYIANGKVILVKPE